MSILTDHYRQVLQTIPAGVKLVAVSKFKPASQIEELYHAGHRFFGENRAPELAEKQVLLPPDIEWHFIGHLQTNKVKLIAPFVSLIQSVDSINLLQEINKQAIKNNRVIDCLLQFHIATEESKFGFALDEVNQFLNSNVMADLNAIRLCGVMGMATFTDDLTLVRSEFKALRSYFDALKKGYFAMDSHFCEVSMGMSGDYRIAIDEGSTLVRIGSNIFGTR